MKAGAPLQLKSRETDQNRFLVERANALAHQVRTKFPEEARWLSSPPPPHRLHFVAVILVIMAAVAGLLSNELGPDKRINILSFPLIGIILWSILVYIRELTLILRRRKPGGLTMRWLELISTTRGGVGAGGKQSPREPGTAESLIRSAELRFRKEWIQLTAPASFCRVKSFLHLTAFILAASAIGGMYINGLANEYHAVWESTFITESSQLRPLLQTVLGPAVSLSGNLFPGTEELDAIHWSRADNGGASGENATRWIHWYALTIGLYVLIPRMFLALVWQIRAFHHTRHLPLRSLAPRYFERILATATGPSHPVHIVPYAFEPGEEGKRALTKCLESHFGQSVSITWNSMVPFGEEEDFSLQSDEGEWDLLPLFNFSSTPEKESHLAFFHTLSGQTPNPVRFALLDPTAFDRKSATFPGAEKRREERLSAWEKLFKTESTTLVLFPESSAGESTTPS